MNTLKHCLIWSICFGVIVLFFGCKGDVSKTVRRSLATSDSATTPIPSTCLHVYVSEDALGTDALVWQSDSSLSKKTADPSNVLSMETFEAFVKKQNQLRPLCLWVDHRVLFSKVAQLIKVLQHHRLPIRFVVKNANGEHVLLSHRTLEHCLPKRREYMLSRTCEFCSDVVDLRYETSPSCLLSLVKFGSKGAWVKVRRTDRAQMCLPEAGLAKGPYQLGDDVVLSMSETSCPSASLDTLAQLMTMVDQREALCDTVVFDAQDSLLWQVVVNGLDRVFAVGVVDVNWKGLSMSETCQPHMRLP